MAIRKLGAVLALATALSCASMGLAQAGSGHFGYKLGMGSISNSNGKSLSGFVFGIDYKIPASNEFDIVLHGESVLTGQSYKYLDDKVNVTVTNYLYGAGVDWKLAHKGPIRVVLGGLAGYNVSEATLRYKDTYLSQYSNIGSVQESGMAYGVHATLYLGNWGLQLESRTASENLNFVGLSLVYR